MSSKKNKITSRHSKLFHLKVEISFYSDFQDDMELQMDEITNFDLYVTQRMCKALDGNFKIKKIAGKWIISLSIKCMKVFD